MQESPTQLSLLRFKSSTQDGELRGYVARDAPKLAAHRLQTLEHLKGSTKRNLCYTS